MRLTIGMPTYNHDSYLENRIISYLTSMPHDSELIIVNDCSTDNTDSIIKKFISNDNRIKYISNKKNIGVNRSANSIAEIAKGEYIALQAADDLIYPSFFSDLLDAADKFKDASIIFSDFASFDDSNPSSIQVTKTISDASINNQMILLNPSDFLNLLRKGMVWIPGSTSLVKTNVLKKHGCFDCSTGPYSDWLVLHQIGLNHKIAYLPKVIALYRKSDTCYSVVATSEKKMKEYYILNILNSCSQNWDVYNKVCNSLLLKDFIQSNPKCFFYSPKYLIFYIYFYLYKSYSKTINFCKFI